MLNVKVGTFVYPVFQVYISYTFDNLIGDTGGVIGLWIGAGILSLVHILVFFFKRCLAAKFKSSKKERKCMETHFLPKSDQGLQEVFCTKL